MADNVISLDSDSDEEPTAPPAADVTASEATSQTPASDSTEVEAQDSNTICLDDDSEPNDEGSDQFNFEECDRILNSYSSRTTGNAKQGRSGGQTCANSWCSKVAVQKGNELILEHYNLPKGNSKFCQDCIDDWELYLESCMENMKNGTSIINGQCPKLNDFIVLDDLDGADSNEVSDDGKDGSSSDPEMEELLTKAINEVLDETEKEFRLENSLEQTYKDLDNIFADTCQLSDECTKKLRTIEQEWYSSVEEFKGHFKKKVKNVEELDLPTLTLEQTGSSPRENSQPESSKGEMKEPADLPPYNTVTRPRPLKGSKCYTTLTDSKSEWVERTVTNVTHENDNQSNIVEMFQVEAQMGGKVMRKKVACDGIAYPNPHPDRLHVGFRVIAAVNQDGEASEEKPFYSGVIAELPTHLNGFRYLIFFETGHVQYCPHKDVRLIYKTRKRISEYFTGSMTQFILNYLTNFPHRCLLKTEVGSFVSVQRDGFWMNATVDKLDSAIMRITFVNDDKHEWIYRGSPRLLPIFERMNNQRSSLRSQFLGIRSGPSAARSGQKQLLVPGEIVISDSSSSSGDEDNNGMDAFNLRGVAKKTTSRPPMNYPFAPSGPKRVTRSSSIIRRIPEVQYPRAFFPHKCSRACVTWVRYVEGKTIGVALLAIPSMFAFRREIDMSTEVAYITPCGKRLSSLRDVLKYLSDTYIPLTLDMFDFDTRSNIFDEFVVESKFIIMQDISFGGERSPIPCINDVNNDCPDLMTYMTERRALDGVHINTDPGFLVCCDCEDNCRDKFRCQCWKHTVDNYRPFNPEDDRRNLKKVGYEYQRLYQNVLSGVYECNSQCKCNPVTCINRVVQHGMRHKLQLFKTPKKGWGTRTAIDIPQGVFICTYVGNIMPEHTANETGMVHGDEYFAELDHIEVMQQYKANFEKNAASMSEDEEEEDEVVETGSSLQGSSSSMRARRSCTLRKNNRYAEISPKKKKDNARQAANSQRSKSTPTPAEEDAESDEETDTVRKFYGPNETVYVMDAKIAGNIGRYFNHSCDPNMFVQNVYIDTHDLRFPWVAFFALKHIPAGSELTWDYGYSIGSVPGKILYCYCNSVNCRKRLL
ncbi:Histone-lysine N-methyltransferase [Nesidiocoris tenuis]|nr:Histone-lysine N-methyltransferase [Nesidiocoris tenuis]